MVMKKEEREDEKAPYMYLKLAVMVIQCKVLRGLCPCSRTNTLLDRSQFYVGWGKLPEAAVPSCLIFFKHKLHCRRNV